MAPVKSVNLNIEVNVLTKVAIAKLVVEILEFLLYQRNQIPLVYSTFKYIVHKWAEDESVPDGLSKLRLSQQRETAKNTQQSISSMRQIILKSFENHRVKGIRFLFGSTPFTAIEAYTINIPLDAISCRHIEKHHIIPQNRINQILISLLTCEDLYNVFSTNIRATNVFCEIETVDSTTNGHNPCEIENFVSSEFINLPLNCKHVELSIKHQPPTNGLLNEPNCCESLSIFEDDNTAGNEGNASEEMSSLSSTSTCWWESEIVIRGLRTNGMDIWTMH